MRGPLLLLSLGLLVMVTRPCRAQECPESIYQRGRECPAPADYKYAPGALGNRPAPPPEPPPAAAPPPPPPIVPAPPPPPPVVPEPARRSLPPPPALTVFSAPAPSRALRPWKWTTLVGGLVLVGAGAALIALDEHDGRQCWMPSDVTTCQQVLQTRPAGFALVGVGGAALVSSVVLFTLDARRERRKEHRDVIAAKE